MTTESIIAEQKQIFIAKLAHDVTEDDLEREFGYFGDHGNILLKPGYAFIVRFAYSSNIARHMRTQSVPQKP